MSCQVIAPRSITGATASELSRTVRALDRVVSATNLNCRTASAVARRPNDPGPAWVTMQRAEPAAERRVAAG
jgi:hypothetical protein